MNRGQESPDKALQAFPDKTPEDLYEAALSEDILIVYTVTTRVTQTKEDFEKEYPGLCVEIRDLRSPDLVEAICESAKGDGTECDVVICNDNSGDFKRRLMDTGIVVPYIPEDISVHMKEGHTGERISFLDEAEMLFYNSDFFDEVPVQNIWELTEERFRGRVYMPSPLRSFSTYTLCGSVFTHSEELEEAYIEYAGKELTDISEDAASYFWHSLSENMVFTNSSDEVMEGLKTGDADFGFMVSSKMRFKDMGYTFEPVYRLEPFTGCKTTCSVMMAADSKNSNTARLFIRFLLGGGDGNGKGYKPFCTEGTWSVRDDVKDGNEVPISEIDLIEPEEDYLIKNKEDLDQFWSEILTRKFESRDFQTWSAGQIQARIFPACA